MILTSQQVDYIGDITYTSEDETLDHIEKCGRLCYRSELSGSIEGRNKILNAWYGHGHTSLYEHSQIVLNIAPVYTEAKAFVFDLLGVGLYRFFDLDFFHSFHLIGGNLRVWLEAYDTIGERHPKIFAGLKAAFPMFLDHWQCESNDKLLIDRKYIPPLLHRHAVYAIVDRGVLAEWTRHDFGFSVESSRYCNYSKDKYGNEIQIHDQDDIGFFPKDDTRESEEKARMLWKESCAQSEKAYLDMLEYVKPEIARQVLNMSLITRMHISGIPWYWDNFFKLRDDKAAHPNIRILAHELRKQMKERGYKEEK
jgi:thymidylate synthase (FAD)